jgi:hypothetical protein
MTNEPWFLKYYQHGRWRYCESWMTEGNAKAISTNYKNGVKVFDENLPFDKQLLAISLTERLEEWRKHTSMDFAYRGNW